ncbi:hypothetical protein NECAME_10139 [Necator americanus]|uniref:Calponin-homology (CH) domain-containing protein n=1 Tax=Necator americanus TaxID=51031 RepID=W2TCR0_NECAM|nr:hypothetical protein NECAME_10139 [Necator americanus]ETN78777.1 hypothetical protein NECAME_10139 [Necator americanus]
MKSRPNESHSIVGNSIDQRLGPEAVKIYTDWVNRYLSKAPNYKPIDDICNELRDYRLVAKLIQVVDCNPSKGGKSPATIPYPNCPKTRTQYIEMSVSSFRSLLLKGLQSVKKK